MDFHRLQHCKSLGCAANFSDSGESHVLGCPPFPLVVTIVVTSKVSMFWVGISINLHSPLLLRRYPVFQKKKWPLSVLSFWFPLEEVVHLYDMLKKGEGLHDEVYQKKQHNKITWVVWHERWYILPFFLGLGDISNHKPPLLSCEAQRLSEVVLRKHQCRCLQEIFRAMNCLVQQRAPQPNCCKWINS